MPWTYGINDFKRLRDCCNVLQKIIEKKKKNQEEFRIKEVIKRKDDKLYVKWKGYNN